MGRKVIGLIPAGGQATRIAPLPCSKELYPIGFWSVDQEHGPRPKVVCHYLLEKMRLAKITQAYIILRENKWDIPAYWGDGKMVGMHLAYLMMDLPFGVPYTLDQAYPFVSEATIALGFPDILFQPEHAFAPLLRQQQQSNADIVLGLFPASRPSKMDMVDLDAAGRVRSIQIKPPQTQLHYTWIIAVWAPTFTRFMHEYVMLDQQGSKPDRSGQGELFMSEVVLAALEEGLSVESVLFEDGACLDIGTPEDMVSAVQGAGRVWG